jgi:hypothetical protein
MGRARDLLTAMEDERDLTVVIACTWRWRDEARPAVWRRQPRSAVAVAGRARQCVVSPPVLPSTGRVSGSDLVGPDSWLLTPECRFLF